MKRMKKLLAFLTSGLLAAMPILYTVIPAQAVYYPTGDTVIEWGEAFYSKPYQENVAQTTMTVNTATEGLTTTPLTATYQLFEEYYTAEEQQNLYTPEEIRQNTGTGVLVFVCKADDYYQVGDTITVKLPISFRNAVVECDWVSWSATLSGTTVKATCKESINNLIIIVHSNYSEEQEKEFWFIPMKTQLNIAAEIVATKGGTAIAEADGDFALSYGIMKWLDEHPGVVLKYNLLYKGTLYKLTIPGGGKLANPEIPWYGPEYLIGKFKK